MKIHLCAIAACRLSVVCVMIMLLAPAAAWAEWPSLFGKKSAKTDSSKPVWPSANELGDRSIKPRAKPNMLANLTHMPKKLYTNTKAVFTPPKRKKKSVAKKPDKQTGYQAEALKKSDKPAGLKSWFVADESHSSRTLNDFMSAPKVQP